jgi:AraC-like DNA-binding protein
VFNENEYALFCDTWQRSHVPVTLVSPEDLTAQIQPKTVYQFQDGMHSSFTVFSLPRSEQPNIVLIGPYARDQLSPERIPEIAEQGGISPQSQQSLADYLLSIPVVTENSPLLHLLDCFCQRMWDGPYEVRDSRINLLSDSSYNNDPHELDDTVLTMKNMERRYEMENEMIAAVMQGAEQKLVSMFSHFNERMFEKRNTDPLRNSKNYCIITNTLLRKAAERGGVHPIQLDRISSRYALRIEQLPSAGKTHELLLDMLKNYCRLVREHNSGNYSPLVQSAVTAIRSDPSAELNLHRLAEQLHVSNVHLSTVFKKETGQTLTAFIRDTRMSHAMHLLHSTNLQIQTVALHCGMVDVHYFSKLFKQHTGLTPTQFRSQPQDMH